MNLNLERPLLFFDIESTGLNIASDSIIELSFVKILPGNEQRIKTWRVRPWDYVGRCQRPINPSAMAVHGITNEELVECPTFYDIIDEVTQWLEDSDLAGFNSAKFDLPMLAEEIERVRTFTDKKPQINLHEKKMVDVQNIFHALEPRNLENAHAAEADTLATYEVLKAQLDKYPETLKNDVGFLSNFSERQKNVDYAGRLAYNDKKEPVITFGKHKGKTAKEVYLHEPSYFSWIEQGEFTLDTKRQFALLRQEFDKEKKAAAARPLNEEELNASLGMLAGKWSGGNGKLF